MNELKVAVFGVGGFAANYIDALKQPRRDNVRLVGAVDPFVAEFDACPIYKTAEDLFAEQSPDLVCIATPIHFHAEQAVKAFEHGCHVMLEKPLSATVESAREIIAARDRAGKMLSIGFQWCHDPVVRAVKADADAGVFGKPVKLRSIVLYPREKKYFDRGSHWAGKKYDPEGRPIFDSVLSNATAHYLMNMLFMVSSPVDTLECATYRCNQIETFDTAVLKARAASGAELFIAVSHAAGRENEQQPMLEYTFERATVRYGARGCRGMNFTAEFSDGRVKDYGIEGRGRMEGLWNMVDAIRNGSNIGCSGEQALLHVDAIQKMRNAQPEAIEFPKKWVLDDGGMLWIPNLKEKLFECYQNRALPAWDFSAERL